MARFEVELSDGRIVEVESQDTPTYDQVLKALESQERLSQVKKERSFKEIESGVPVDPNLFSNLSQLLQREEAAFATPALRIAKKLKETSLGKESQTKLDPSLILKDIQSGVMGESFSPYGEGRQTELGDIARELGISDPLAGGLGLIASSFLPSSIVGGTPIRALSKVKKTKTILPVAHEFENVVRQFGPQAKGMEGRIAETLEGLTNIESEYILYALKNPEVLTRENANPETIADLSRVLAKKVKDILDSGDPNQLLGPNENVPLEIARQITEQFRKELKEAGKNVHKAENIISGTKGRIPRGDIERKVRQVMGRYIDTRGNLKPIFQDDPIAKALNEIKEELNKLPVDKEGRITLSALLDYKERVRNIGFSHGLRSTDGINRPLPEIQGATNAIYGYISGLIEREFVDVPEVIDAFKRYSQLADIRGDVAYRLNSPEKLAAFIRRFDRKDPEQLVLLQELLSSIPGREKFINELELFLNINESSLKNIFPFIESRDLDKIASGFESLLRKEIRSPDLDLRSRKGLDRLQRITGVPIISTYLDHHTASQFNKRSNFFRVLAAGGIALSTLGFPNLGIGVFGAGMLLTDPRTQGAIIRRMVNPTRNILPKASSKIAKTTPPLLRAGITQAEEPSQAEREFYKEELGLGV